MSIREPTGTDTLDHARAYVDERDEDGVVCPCCTRYVKVYRRTLNSTIVRGLLWLVEESGQDLAWVDTGEGPKFVTSTRQLPTARHWNLVEGHPDGGRLWRPTLQGVAFAAGNLRTNQAAYILDNVAIDFSDELVDVRAALGTKYDYDEVMARAELPHLDQETTQGLYR